MSDLSETAGRKPLDHKLTLIAAILSAFLPGCGQLLLGQSRKGITLLATFAALTSLVWLFRLPTLFAGFFAIILAWLTLSVYASATALFSSEASASPRSRLWWIAVPVFVYVGFNLSFTPIFWLAGFRAFKVKSSAMQPTLYVGEYFVMDTRSYEIHPPSRDDLVAMNREGFITVKRVIAASGQTIQGRNQNITVNESLLREPFIQHSQPSGAVPELDTFGPITIPAGKFFVMGDNRDVSHDSREAQFGLVDRLAIKGKPLYIYRSPLHDRAGRSLQ